MDNTTRRFIAIFNKLLAELRLLRNGVDQAVDAILDAEKKADKDKEKPPPKMLVDVGFTDQVVREKRISEERNYRLQKSLRNATWCAFITAAVYAGIAALQWRQMKRATSATEVAANAAQRSAKASETQVEATKKAIEANIEQSRLEQRAWVGAISPADFAFRVGERGKCSVIIENTGRTPALYVKNGFTAENVPAGQTPTFRYAPPITCGASVGTVVVEIGLIPAQHILLCWRCGSLNAI